MKLIFLFLIISLIQVAASTKAQTITLNKQNISITAVFEEIMMQSDYDFSYSDQQISKVGRINISVTNASITEVLDKCFEGQALTYTISNNTITIKNIPQPFFKRIQKRFSAVIISGTVADEQGNALRGATVKLQSSKTMTSTDDKGFFSINSDEESGVLSISFLGYVSERISFSSNKVGPFKVILKQETSGLEEVEINAGYYTVKDRERTGSISRVTSETINKQPVSNVLGALIGRMAGVNIQQQSGINGGGFSIEIRGRNSLRAEGRDPLFLIDGVPYPSASLTSPDMGVSGISRIGSPLNYINPGDIESIEILKDADATAIYGSRGANGVVLITTKTAKEGKTTIDVNIYSGYSEVASKLKLLNTSQYLEMRNEAFRNDGATPGLTDYDVNGTWDQNRYTDWQNELIGGTAKTTNIQTGINGGNEFTKFAFRGNYSKQTTVYPGDFADQKGAGLLTINHSSANQKFKIDFSANYSINYNNLPIRDLASRITLAPNSPALYNSDGTINWALNTNGAATWDNPIAAMINDYTSKTNTSVSNSVLSYKIAPGLTAKSSFGYTNIRLRENVLSRIGSVSPSTNARGFNRISNNTFETWIIEPQLNYKRVLGAGDLDILIGTTYQKNDQKYELLYGNGYTNDLLLESITAAPSQGGSSSASQYNYNAVFGRVNYNFESKYIINLTGRRDGSSRFGPDRQFANFGAIGVAWIFSKESSIETLTPMLSYGKVRGSYGITGSDQIADYGYLETYAASDYPYQDGSGLIPTRIANPDYSWETNKKIEAAIELGFFKDRFNFSTSWYKNRSSDQLVGYSLADITGFSSIQYNLPATVENSGWEFELRSINITDKNLNWTSSLNLTIPKNKLVNYPNIEGSSYANTYRVGDSMYSSIAYHYLGVNAESGLYDFQDVNGNGLDANDRKFVTEPITTKLFGGLNNTLSYRNFQFDIFFQFAAKTLKDPITQFGTPGILSNQPEYILQRWQKPGDRTNYQKFSRLTGTGSASQRITTYLINSDRLSDASFIRLKNVSLAWNAPEKWVKKASFSNVKIFLQGQNLFTITNYFGDPEIGIITTLPTLKTIIMGIQVVL